MCVKICNSALRIEWLRTEAYSLIRPHQKVASERTPSADDFIDYNDIPEDGEDATGFCANCIEPRVAGEVQLRACGHWLCDTCSSYTWQVYHAQERQPRCPVPNCKTLTTQLGTECALELWLKVSKHIGNTWFQAAERLYSWRMLTDLLYIGWLLVM